MASKSVRCRTKNPVTMEPSLVWCRYPHPYLGNWNRRIICLFRVIWYRPSVRKCFADLGKMGRKIWLSWVCRYDCDGRTVKPLKNRQTPEKLTSSNTSVGTLDGLYLQGSFPNALKSLKKKLKKKLKDMHSFELAIVGFPCEFNL